MGADLLDPQLQQELERAIHSHEVLERESDQLESPGVLPQGGTILGELREVVGALEGHPAREGGLQLPHQLPAHVEEPRAPRREQPFLGPAGEQVHRRGPHIEGDLA